MIRITSARMTFQGFSQGRDRASEITHRALRLLAEHSAPAERAAARARVQLTVRVPHGTPDNAIAARIADAIDRQLVHQPGRRADRTER